MREPGEERRAGARGQALTETLLMTWGLFLLFCIVLQAFLIDQHAFELATQAHARLFSRGAYPGNKPSVTYETRWPQKLEGPGEYVPVVGFFKMYGLTRGDLRIRSTHRERPGGYKRIKLGRGTRTDVFAGLEGLADPAAFWSQISEGMDLLDQARRLAQEAKDKPPGGRK